MNTILITGWEHGVNPTTNGGGLASAVSGSPTVDAASKRSGGYGLHINVASAATQSQSIPFSTATAGISGQIYLKIKSWPSGEDATQTTLWGNPVGGSAVVPAVTALASSLALPPTVSAVQNPVVQAVSSAQSLVPVVLGEQSVTVIAVAATSQAEALSPSVSGEEMYRDGSVSAICAVANAQAIVPAISALSRGKISASSEQAFALSLSQVSLYAITPSDYAAFLASASVREVNSLAVIHGVVTNVEIGEE